jgi:signal transduction histidine kinase
MKENKILIDAIGSVLDRHDSPLPILELVSMLNEGYLEYIDEDPIEDVTEDAVEQCVKKNSELFDNYFGVISLKNQMHNSIDEIEKELKEYLYRSSDRRILDFILCYLLFLRYDAVHKQFALRNLSTAQLIFRTYSEPERLDCSVITNLINQYTELYGGESCNEEFVFDNEDYINERLGELVKIVRRIDWRFHKLSTRHFDELVAKLQKLNRSSYSNEAVIPDELSKFIQSFLVGQNTHKITEVHSSFADFIPFLTEEEKAKTEIEINAEEKIRSIQSGLRVALKGYSNVRINCTSISSQQQQDSDIIISLPPFGNIPKSFWAEEIINTEVEISSIEEVYTSLAILRLKETGKAYLILPESFLSGKRKSLINLREKLIRNGWLDTIIKLPRRFTPPHMSISLNLVILNLQGVNSTYFFDLMEFDRQSQSDFDITSCSVSELIQKREKVQNISREVDFSSILDMNDNLSVNKHISPIYFPEVHERSDSEKLMKLCDLVNVIRPKRERVTQEHPFVNMTELSDEPSDYVLDYKSLPKKRKYSNNQPLLNEDALLVGTVGGVLKPTLFQFNNNPIFLGSNVYSLRIDTPEIDPEYLIFELNTVFVKNQVKRYTKGTTIPHINKSDLLNIVIRVPEKQEQARLFNEWITGIARNKIESLNIEKEKLFSDEFDLIHDMHHTLKNELSILKGAFRDIKVYMVQKSKSKKVIDLTEPIREIKEGADPSLYDTVEEKINATERSLHQMSSFVRDYKTILKFDPKNQNPQWVKLKDYLLNLCSEYKGFDYIVEEETSVEPGGTNIESYQLKVDKALLRMIVTNVIENARNHGFSNYKGEKLIEILIRDNFDTTSYTDIKDSSGNIIDQVDVSDNWIEVVVRNTGEIIEDDDDPKKVFERGVGKGGGNNKGIGLSHVNKAMKSLKGEVEIVRPNDSIFSFEIRLKFPLSIGKSPNWDTIDTITRDE